MRSRARYSPADAAVLAIKAGNDVVLHSPDDAAAVVGIKTAVEKGELPIAQIDASVRRILRAKARLGLHKTKLVALDDVPKRVGGRQNAAIASRLSQKSITLLKDDRNQVPLRTPREGAVLYLSLLDYGSGLEDRGAGPDVHSGAAEALAERHGHRAVGSCDRLGNRSRPRHRHALRRHRRRRSSSVRPLAAGGWISRRRWCGC